MDKKPKILIADDSYMNREILSDILGDTYVYSMAENGVQAVELMQEDPNIDLIMLDINMPEMDGFGVLEFMKKWHCIDEIPVIIISAQDAETAKIMALNAGADDYVTVGYNPLELLARVKSQLRRYTQLVNLCESIDSIYRVDGLEINDRNRTVTVDGREVKMTPIEYKILRLLVQERGKVLSISQIYESIWHMQAIGADNTIAVHIRHIREKIESNPKEPRYLKVVWGPGYKVG